MVNFKLISEYFSCSNENVNRMDTQEQYLFIIIFFCLCSNRTQLPIWKKMFRRGEARLGMLNVLGHEKFCQVSYKNVHEKLK
jgi:hypothetical protein